MKKTLFLMVCLFVSITSFAGNPVIVKSGNVDVIKQHVGAILEFDYSKTKIEGKELHAYLKDRGGDVAKDWPSDNEKAKSYFVQEFNKKNDKGMFVSTETNSPYKIIVHVSTLDLGNTAASFLSFSAKGGGAIMTGTIDIVNAKTNKSECTLEITELKAISHPSEVIRRGLLYASLAKNVSKLVKY